MQKFYIAAIGAAAFAALPALAQTSSTGSNATTNSNSSMSTSNTGANGSTTPMSQADMGRLQQKITADLQNDGYKNVRVVPNSFLIHAENKSGQPIVMIINPDSVFAITDVGNQGNPNGAGRNGGALGSNTAPSGANNSNTTTKQ